MLTLVPTSPSTEPTPSTRKGGTGSSQVAVGERNASTALAQAGTTPASVPRACSRAVRVRGICRRHVRRVPRKDIRRVPSTREPSSGQKKQVGSALPDPTLRVYLETAAPAGESRPSAQAASRPALFPRPWPSLPTGLSGPGPFPRVLAGSHSGHLWMGLVPPPRPPPPLLLVRTLPSCWEAPSGETVLVGADAGRQSASPGGRGGLALSHGTPRSLDPESRRCRQPRLSRPLP